MHPGIQYPSLNLEFEANIYGPFASRLNHLLNGLDGSYLHCDKRISDASPLDVIWFDDEKKSYLQAYLKSDEVKPYVEALEHTAVVIDGFETPFGMELMATVDWLITREGAAPTVAAVREGLRHWPSKEPGAAKRKDKIFDDRALNIALERLITCQAK